MNVSRFWYLRKDGGAEYGPVAEEVLRAWAAEGRVAPEDWISTDRENWIPPHELASLEMDSRRRPYLRKTCEALGTAPARTLMIGDSSNDALAARAAGCPVLLVTYGYNHGEPVRAVDADGFVDHSVEGGGKVVEALFVAILQIAEVDVGAVQKACLHGDVSSPVGQNEKRDATRRPSQLAPRNSPLSTQLARRRRLRAGVCAW